MPKNYEQRAQELGLEIPDFHAHGYYGADTYGSMKSHHIVGNVLYLSGHTPDTIDGTVRFPGRLGQDLSVEEGYEAAGSPPSTAWVASDTPSAAWTESRASFAHCALSRPRWTSRTCTGCPPALTNLFVDLLRREAGLGGRATIGVMSLAGGSSFENWVTVEIED